MAERRVVVGSAVGLHARPAALFVPAATKSPLAVGAVVRRIVCVLVTSHAPLAHKIRA